MVELNPETIASGLVGIVVFGAMIRQFLVGWKQAEAQKAAVVPSMVQGFSIAWDRDQQERFLQMIERLTLAGERMAKSLEELANRQAHDMQEQLDFLVERMNDIPAPSTNRRRAATRRAKKRT